MRRPLIASTLILAAVMATTLVPVATRAQGQKGQLPSPPAGFKPPPAAPVKPYQPVAVTMPGPYSDPSFAAFRKELGEVADHKDRAALAKLVVAKGFFWMQDKDLADPKKSGVTNLAKAIDLDAKDGSGWDTLVGFANEASAAPLPNHPGVICTPAPPTVDPKGFQALIGETHTSPMDWAFPVHDGLEVRNAAEPKAPVIDKLGMNLLRVLSDNAQAENGEQPQFLRVATPSGKTGFVPAEEISGFGGDEMCYVKEAGGWKITGYFGGDTE